MMSYLRSFLRNHEHDERMLGLTVSPEELTPDEAKYEPAVQDVRSHTDRINEHYQLMWDKFDRLRDDLEHRIQRDQEELRQVLVILNSITEAKMIISNPNMPLAPSFVKGVAEDPST